MVIIFLPSFWLLNDIREYAVKQTIKDKDLFELIIDFEQGGDPARIFKAMSDLIDVLQQIDQTLGEIIGLKIKHSLLLENVKQDCFKAIIRNTITAMPEVEFTGKSSRQVISDFLVETKFILLHWCQQTSSLSSDKELTALEKNLFKMAKKSAVNKIPAYQMPSRSKLLKNISNLRKTTRYLLDKDAIFFVCVHGQVSIHDGIDISDAMVNEVLIKQVIQKRDQALLQVKRPDYLGHAKWLLKHNGYSVDVMVLDEAWLQQFQRKEVLVQPGDSLRGILLQHIAFGHDMEIISIRYELEVVYEVVEAFRSSIQARFDI